MSDSCKPYTSGMDSVLRVVIVVVLVGIVASLGSALFHLSHKQGDSAKLVRALTVRIGLSLALFALLMAAWYFGLISPHGIDPAR